MVTPKILDEILNIEVLGPVKMARQRAQLQYSQEGDKKDSADSARRGAAKRIIFLLYPAKVRG